MITMEAIVRAARLSPTVGPFTIRRLMLRAGVLSSEGYSETDLRKALPGIEAELVEILPPAEAATARRDLGLLAGSIPRSG